MTIKAGTPTDKTPCEHAPDRGAEDRSEPPPGWYWEERFGVRTGNVERPEDLRSLADAWAERESITAPAREQAAAAEELAESWEHNAGVREAESTEWKRLYQSALDRARIAEAAIDAARVEGRAEVERELESGLRALGLRPPGPELLDLVESVATALGERRAEGVEQGRGAGHDDGWRALVALVAPPSPKAAPPEPAWVADVLAERRAQDEQWGGATHDDEHEAYEWMDYINKQVKRAQSVRNDNEAFRSRLVKIAALAGAGVESIDRNTHSEPPAAPPLPSPLDVPYLYTREQYAALGGHNGAPPQGEPDAGLRAVVQAVLDRWTEGTDGGNAERSMDMLSRALSTHMAPNNPEPQHQGGCE